MSILTPAVDLATAIWAAWGHPQVTNFLLLIIFLGVVAPRTYLARNAGSKYLADMHNELVIRERH